MDQHRTHGPRFSQCQWAGLDLLTLENEHICLVVCPALGSQILEFRHKATDLDVLWKNPRLWPPRGPHYSQPASPRGELYDHLHGGWFVSLPNGFFPENWPDAAGPALGCHGEMHCVEWQIESLNADADEVRVCLTGRGVRAPLRVERVWRLSSGSLVLDWTETLINECSHQLPVAWLHHPAFGGPFIEGSHVFAAAHTLRTPPSQRPELNQLRGDFHGSWPHAPLANESGVRDCSVVPAAGDGAEHVVELLDFARGWGGVWNPRLKLGFALAWDKNLFPCAWSWATGRSDGYPLWGGCHTVTLQPSTSPMRPFSQLVQSGEVLWIEGFGQIGTRLQTGFCTDPEQVWVASS